MGNFWTFATAWPGTACIMVIAVSWVCICPFSYAYRAYARRMRAMNISAHGWPTPPMDADGDIVYPKSENDDD